MTAGSSALYVLLYSTHYFFTNLPGGIYHPVSILLYFGYTLLFCLTFFVFSGTIGFLACSKFVHKIYSSLTPEELAEIRNAREGDEFELTDKEAGEKTPDEVRGERKKEEKSKGKYGKLIIGVYV
jgi:hypothetical protein